MKVRALTEIPTARGIIPTGQIIEIPESVMEKLKGKVVEILPTVKPLKKRILDTLKADCPETDIIGPVAPARAMWFPENQALVDWYMQLDPPEVPFYLEPHICVVDPVKFFVSLRREIEAGPSGPRARRGALQTDLRKLKAFLN